MNDQQLSLDLSMRSIPSPDVLAVNLDSYSILLLCAVVVVFVKGGECLYIPAHSPDAQKVAEWANSQLAEQFLKLPDSHCFNIAHIFETKIGDDVLTVTMDSIETRFEIPATRSAKAALVAWQSGEDSDATQPRAAVLA